MGESHKVRDVMQSEVVTLERNDELSLADDVMRLGRIRHMPILDEEGALAGVLSQRDLFRGALARTLGYGEHAQRKLQNMLRVKDVMTTEPVTVDPDTPLADAARLMIERKIGCLLVVKGTTLVGILTEGDFVSLAAKG